MTLALLEPEECKKIWSFVLLAVAVAIDLVDLLPFNVPAAALTTLFLVHLGVTPALALVGGLMDLVPLLDLFPWCTLAVLYKRFGVTWGLRRIFRENI